MPASTAVGPAFRDGLGERRYVADPSGNPTLEQLCLRSQLAIVPSFEFALRERLSRLATFRHDSFARARSIERMTDRESTLAVVSERVNGVRLTELLQAAEQRRLGLDITAALYLIKQLVPAVAALHESAREIAHGAIGPDRLVVTPDGRLVIMEHVLGAALEQLRFTRERYWTELRIALPSSAGLPRFDQRADVNGIGLVVLSLVLGRPLRDDEFPARLADVVASTWAVSPSGGFEPLPGGFRAWLGRALQLDARNGFNTGIEARAELEKVLSDGADYIASESNLTAFLARYNSTQSPSPTRLTPTPAPAQQPVSSRRSAELEDTPPLGLPIPPELVAQAKARSLTGSSKKSEPASQPLAPPALSTNSLVAPPSPNTIPARGPAIPAASISKKTHEPTPARGTAVSTTQTPPRGMQATSAPQPPAHTPARGIPAVVPPGAPIRHETGVKASEPLEIQSFADAIGRPATTPARGTPVAAVAPQSTTHTPARGIPAVAPPSTTVRQDPSVTPKTPLEIQSFADSVITPAATPPRGMPVAAATAAPQSTFSVTQPTLKRPSPPKPAPQESVPVSAVALSSDEPRRRPRIAVIAGALVALLAIGGVAWWFYARPAPAVVTDGTLVLTTNPSNAQAIVDGRPRGVTPVTLTLPAGLHKLELKTAGGTRTIPFSITAGVQVAQYIELPQAPSAYGQLQVRTTPPGARISVDGVARGVSPVTVSDLSVGEHAVLVESDLGSMKQSVTVESGATAQLVVPLTAPDGAPVSGWIAVSAPIELQLFEGDRLLGTSRSDRIMVAAGRHDLDLVNENYGYKSTRSVQVSPGKVAALAVEMPTGTIALNATPWAEVWIDGSRIGETPIGNHALPIGPHDVVFRHPELGEQRHTANVTLREVARFSVDLRKK